MSREADAMPANNDYETSVGRSRNMAAIRRSDTKPELVVRSALHRRGYRFRKDYAIATADARARPDIAFTRLKVAVFIDGCFWHSCPIHGRQPSRNTSYWSPKLRRNAERDHIQTDALLNAGWQVLRFWEHEASDDVVASIVAELDRRNDAPSARSGQGPTSAPC